MEHVSALIQLASRGSDRAAWGGNEGEKRVSIPLQNIKKVAEKQFVVLRWLHTIDGRLVLLTPIYLRLAVVIGLAFPFCRRVN